MVTARNEYNPDYAVPPGWVLKEHIEAEGISQAEFARRCGRTPKLISEIISGKAPLEPETALQFERVLGVNASIWLEIESDYQLYQTRAMEAEKVRRSAKWLKSFPVKELARRGYFTSPESEADAVVKLLKFFRVGSIDAWYTRYSMENVAYRHSPSFKSDEAALTTWLRLGEIEAEGQDCEEFNAARFRSAVRAIRGLTKQPIDKALRQASKLCNEAGVALVVVTSFPKMALSGAARWTSPDKALIQLTARHGTNDHFWFSFFHEAAHILLHSKKGIFVDETQADDTQLESEANEWASNILVPRKTWDRFVASAPLNHRAIERFAKEQDIAPGIIVGMLQHRKLVSWSRLNELKDKIKLVQSR